MLIVGNLDRSGRTLYYLHSYLKWWYPAYLHLDAVTVACGFLHDVVNIPKNTPMIWERILIQMKYRGWCYLAWWLRCSHEEQLAETTVRCFLMAISLTVSSWLNYRPFAQCTLKHLRKDKQERIMKLWKSMLLWPTV